MGAFSAAFSLSRIAERKLIAAESKESMNRRQISMSEQLLPGAQVVVSGPERVVLVGVGRPRVSTGSGDHARFRPEESLDELARLSETAGLEVSGRIVQTLREGIHPATFIGTGKVAEVKDLLMETGASVVIFDDDLSPAQQRNLETGLSLKVIDRSQLILDIFAQRAPELLLVGRWRSNSA